MSNPTAEKNDFYTKFYFNDAEYTANKAAALNHEKYNGRTNWTADEVKSSFAASNITAYDHFHYFGAYEKDVDNKIGINPSKFFDVSRYYEDKIAKVNKTLPGTTQDMLYNQLKGDGLDAITHFAIFGQSEYVTPRNTNIGRTEYSDYAAIPQTNDWRIDRMQELKFSDVNKLLAQNNNTVYYTFLQQDDNTGAKDFAPMNDNQREGVRQAIVQVTDITGIKFVYTDKVEQANLRFLQGNWEDYGGWTSKWAGNKIGIALTSDTGHKYYSHLQDPRMGKDHMVGYQTIIHEFGHFLGLKHPHEAPTFDDKIYDQTMYSTMSYNYPSADNNNWYFQTRSQDYYSPLDLATLSWIYGTDGIGGNEGLVYRAASAPQNVQLDTMGVDTMGVGDMPLA